MRRCLAQNVLFFVDNENIIVILLPGPLTLLFCLPASGLLNSFSPQGLSPSALPSLLSLSMDHDHTALTERKRTCLEPANNIITVYAHARIHSHTIIYIYNIYIYTHRENLVRNHDIYIPIARA